MKHKQKHFIVIKRNMVAALLLVFAINSFALDYIVERGEMMKLRKRRKYAAAYDGFVKLADDKGVSVAQKTDALKQAVECLLYLKRVKEAGEVAGRITDEPVRKLCVMKILATERKRKELLARFAGENIDAWPDYLQDEAFSLRGHTAYFAKQNKELAESDIKKSLKYKRGGNQISDSWIILGSIYHRMFHDDEKALRAFRKAFAVGTPRHKVQAAVEISDILIEQGKVDEALKLLDSMNSTALQGNYWLSVLTMGKARALVAADRKDEAVEKYKEASKLKGISKGQRKSCERKIKELSQAAQVKQIKE